MSYFLSTPLFAEGKKISWSLVLNQIFVYSRVSHFSVTYVHTWRWARRAHIICDISITARESLFCSFAKLFLKISWSRLRGKKQHQKILFVTRVMIFWKSRFAGNYYRHPNLCIDYRWPQIGPFLNLLIVLLLVILIGVWILTFFFRIGPFFHGY